MDDNIKIEILSLFEKGEFSENIAKKLFIDKRTVISFLNKQNLVPNEKFSNIEYMKEIYGPRDKWIKNPDFLKIIFRYDNGKLFYNNLSLDYFENSKQSAYHNYKIWNGNCAGKEASSFDNSTGYYVVNVFGNSDYAHRVVWRMFYEIEPKIIDHINQNKLDNRIENLRSVNFSENAKNRPKSIYNTSGFNGVSFNKNSNKWEAYYSKDNKRVYLGLFSSKEEAIKARISVNSNLGFLENHGK